MYKVIAIVGKSATGKTTLQRAIKDKYRVNEIVSTTTRPMREGEVEGKDYYFITIDQFVKKVYNYEMLEATEFNGWFYGTEKKALSKRRVNVGVFNLEGVMALAESKNIDLEVIYLDVDDKIRLIRALNREENVDVAEVCRRFFADEKDFSAEAFHDLEQAGVKLTTVKIDNNTPIDRLCLKFAPLITGQE